MNEEQYQPTPAVLVGLLVGSLALAWALNLLSQAVADVGIGTAMGEPMAAADAFLAHMFEAPFSLSLDSFDMIASLVGFCAPWLIFWNAKMRGERRYMFNAEHGTSRWGTRKDAERFEDPTDPYNNIILSATERKALVPKKFDLEADRNNNVLLIGGPGTGKTRYNIKPNLMQLNSSYVVTDPKGTLVPECGTLFCGGPDRKIPEECLFEAKKDLYVYDRATKSREPLKFNGKPVKKGDKIPYEFKVLNLIDFDKSMKYNPLAYMKTEKDILKLVNVFIQNTNGEGAQKGEDFWVKCEQLFYTAIFSYLFFEAPPSQRNFANVVRMLDMAKVKEDDEDYESPLDMIFKEIETGERYELDEDGKKTMKKVGPPRPEHFALRQYHKFKQSAGKTAKSILISCAARLAPFDIDALRDLLSTDELELDRIGDRPTVLFVIIPDTDTTFSFIAAMAFYQMFNLLSDHADNECGGKLDVPVQCLFDEFANVGKVPMFDKLITTLRSRGVSVEIVLQNLGQLDRDYDKAARIIKGGCDTMLYLGGGDPETCKEISERLGKTTIANRSFTRSDGASKSTSVNDQLIARDLMDPAEVERMSRAKCIVQIGGMFAFKSDKYSLESHPRYRYIDPGHKGAEYEDSFDAAKYVEWKRDLARGGRRGAGAKGKGRCVAAATRAAKAVEAAGTRGRAAKADDARKAGGKAADAPKPAVERGMAARTARMEKASERYERASLSTAYRTRRLGQPMETSTRAASEATAASEGGPR